MKLLMSCLWAATCLAPFAPVCAQDSNAWAAVVEKSNETLRSWGFPSRIIDVEFPASFPMSVVTNPANYSLFRSDAPLEGIRVQGVKGAGNRFADTRETQSQVVLLPGVELQLPPEGTSYLLRVQFGDQSSGDIPVAWPADETPAAAPAPSQHELLNLLTVSSNLLFGRIDLTVDARVPGEGSHAPALDFVVNYAVFDQPLRRANDTNFTRMWMGAVNFNGEGTYKFDPGDTNVSDHVSLSANVDLLYLYRLGNPLTRDRQGRLAYYAGFRLTGFELEADQEFDVMNWTVQPQLALWIPYSNIPALWWSRNVGITGNAAAPVFVYAGYSVVDSLRTDPGEVPPGVQEADRVELEVAYAFPVLSSLRVGIRSRFFWLEEGARQDYHEVFARYYLDRTSTTALLFKYTRGAMPPAFQEGESVGGGLTLEF